MTTTWIERLIKQYAAETNQLEKYRGSLNMKNPLAIEEADTVSGMISDMRYALEWMRRGRRPGNRRGVDRTNVYRQRELHAELTKASMDGAESRKLVLVLLDLSERERTCFLLHMAHGLTISEIADRLKVSRTTIQSYVSRARDKVQQGVS